MICARTTTKDGARTEGGCEAPALGGGSGAVRPATGRMHSDTEPRT